MAQRERYGKWTIYYDPPPIPTRACDWHFHHDDYDPTPLHADDPPSDHRAGSAASIEACKREIDEIEADLAEDAK